MRRAFLLFALAMLLVALPALLLVVGSAGWPWALAHALGLAWLMSRWLREYRQGISAPGWDLLDGAALLILCLLDDGFPAAGLFYAATYWRAVTASTPRAVASICGISVLFGAVVVVSDGISPQVAIGPGVGMAASSLLLHLVVAITSRHESQIRRQGAFVDAVLRNLDTGVVACDSTGAVTVVNDAARSMHAGPVETTTPGQIASRYQLHGPDGVTLLEPHEVPMNRALAGEHVRNQEVVLVRDGQRRTVVANARPLSGENGERLGAVVALHDVTATKQAEAALRAQALHDPLTGLPNRVLLLDRLGLGLAHRESHASPLALLFVDLDGFKTVNDSLGHATGDAVLIAVADRLLAVLRPDDTVVRLGGDEFAVLLQDTPESEVSAIAERLLDGLAAPLAVGERHLVITASVGVATSKTADSAGELLRNADLAMYAAKAAGRSRWSWFEPHMHHAAVKQLTLEAELRRAIVDEQLHLAYQPIVDAHTGRILSVEALARWNSPELGSVSPVEFIPVAETSGLIVQLGSWVLQQACRQTQGWNQSHRVHPISVAVNVSFRQLQEPGLVATVAEALSSSGLDPAALTLEITEGALAGDLDAVTILQGLRHLGVSIAIDDFGTGHSSLARLRDLPVDHVKIDRAFVGEIDDRGSAPIASATIALAHSLGLSVVAEGVETRPQVDFLRQHGCDAIQGYLASPPADPDRIGQLLADAQPLLPAGGATPDSRDDQGRRAEAGQATARPLRSPHRQPAPSRSEVPGVVDGVLAGAAPSAS